MLSFILALTAAAPATEAAAPALPLPPALPITQAAKGRLSTVGSEPFWRMEISGPTVMLIEPGEDGVKVEEFTTESSTALGDTAHVWTAGPLSLTVSAGACSDGMSDTVYPYTVEAVFVGKAARVLKGCGYRPWGEDILAALPVIDACLKDAKEFPAILFAAASAPDAGVVLRAGTEAGLLNACTVTAGKATTMPFAGEDFPPGTEREIFVRGPGENPGGECYDAPEVMDAEGRLVGWWLDPEGC